MRRKDREVLNQGELEEIIGRCDCIHLGLMDGEWPYVVPLNFGVLRNHGTFVFYMHGALAGKKLELIQGSDHAAFCMDTEHQILRGASGCEWSCGYESVMGRGRIALVKEPVEKRLALACILRHYGGDDAVNTMPEQTLAHTAVIRLTVESISGKKNLEKGF